MFQFDQHGYLIPYQGIEIEAEALEQTFVDQFLFSEQRRRLFENYQWYLQSFQRDIFPIFEQWINGSFVTAKLNPNDIDIVTYLDHRVFDLKQGVLAKFLSFSLEKKDWTLMLYRIFQRSIRPF